MASKASTKDLELLLESATAEAPDVKNSTSNVNQAHMTTERFVRTELAPDGSIMVYKKGEFRMPNGDAYVGETLNEKRHGRGTYYFASGDVYVGEFDQGIFHGQGVMRKGPFREGGKECIGRSYAGAWVKGYKHGLGKYNTGFGDFYEGEFQDDVYHGRGFLVYANGDRYEGGWFKGRWEGEGTVFYANGNSYQGGFLKGLYHGEGMLRFANGAGSYGGGWRLGCKHGIGKRIFASGAEYEGEYKDDMMCGRGVYKSSIGDLYVGTFKDSLFHGEGTYIKCTGDKYTGQFQRGVPAGVGRWEYERGGFYDGEFAAVVRTGIPCKPKRKWQFDLRNDNDDDDDGAAEEKRSFVVHDKGGKVDSKVSPADAAKHGGSVGGGDDSTRSRTKPNGRRTESTFERAKRMTESKHKRLARERKMEEDRLAAMSPVARASYLEKKKRNAAKKPEDFSAPILVGSPLDDEYIASGGNKGSGTASAADGKRHGRGVRVYADGSRYEGDWYQDAQHGFGVYIQSGALGVRFEGRWAEGKKEGVGVESYGHNDVQSYICPLGNIHDGSARCFYDGEWKQGYYHGVGTFTCCDGRQYAGEWRKGKRHGQGRWVMLPAKLHYGVRTDADGNVTSHAGGVNDAAIGEYGQHITFDEQTRLRVYEGTFVKNKRTGIGKVTLNNGDVMEANGRDGSFVNGRVHGNIRMTFASTGKVSYARFKMGERYAWIGGKELQTLLKRDEDEVKAKIEAAEREARALESLTRVNMFGARTQAAAKGYGKVLALEDRQKR